ncbi:hypothetical protein SAMN05421812_10233 [Asanoa hainanensis]|uniref:Signal transduction histidine kinase n=1 Tax=Asanoa hainanensis TaxID=560556 RepID=A0A239HUH4_9ACTN|nr:hypothetical protein [Asanoa hainanensis]SNS84768.1 hypothetical protein SAMN05421812_10233 [Asanoa hainanensis]
MSAERLRVAGAAVVSNVDRGGRMAAVFIAFGWHIGVNVPGLVGGWDDYRVPWAALAGWVLFSLVGVLATARLFYGFAVPVVPLLAVLLIVDVLVIAVVPDGGFFNAYNWAWGTIGWFAILLLYDRGVAALVAVLAANAAFGLIGVVAANTGSGAVDLSRFVMYVYGTGVLPIALVAAMGVLRDTARSAAANEAARAALESERLGAAHAQRERQHRLGIVSEAGGALLHDLATGRADPADPDVQRACALAAAQLRRLIAESDDVPDPLLHELRACVDVAERQGVPVDLIAVGELPVLDVAIRRRLAEPLAATLATARDWARVTVVAQPDEVVVSLTTPATAGPAKESHSWPMDGVVDYWYERDEELVWTQTRWRAA